MFSIPGRVHPASVNFPEFFSFGFWCRLRDEESFGLPSSGCTTPHENANKNHRKTFHEWIGVGFCGSALDSGAEAGVSSAVLLEQSRIRLPAIVFDFVQIKFVNWIVIRAFAEWRLALETKRVHWKGRRWLGNHLGPLIFRLGLLWLDEIAISVRVIKVSIWFSGGELVEGAVMIHETDGRGRWIEVVGILIGAALVSKGIWSVKKKEAKKETLKCLLEFNLLMAASRIPSDNFTWKSLLKSSIESLVWCHVVFIIRTHIDQTYVRPFQQKFKQKLSSKVQSEALLLLKAFHDKTLELRGWFLHIKPYTCMCFHRSPKISKHQDKLSQHIVFLYPISQR